MKVKKINVKTKQKNYSIYIGNNILNKIIDVKDKYLILRS